MTVRVVVGNALDKLREMPAESVHCVVTSPPYWGLRDYGVEPSIWGGGPACEHEWGEPQRTANANSMPGPNGRGGKNGDGRRNETKFTGPFCQSCGAWRGAFGLEPTPELFIDHLVEIFDEVRRVLRADGTLWLNLGDSYATGAGAVGARPGGGAQGDRWAGASPERGERTRGLRDGRHAGKHTGMAALGPMTQPNRMPIPGLKPKDLVGIPWMAAFALRRAGWWLRQDIIWAKPNPMPESVTDRCTKSHEYLFLMTKSERYYFDSEAISETVTLSIVERLSQPTLDQQYGSDRVPGKTNGPMKAHVPKRSGNKERKAASQRGVPVDDEGKPAGAVAGSVPWEGMTRNKRSVWTVTTQPFSEAHFATFPPALIEPCILAGWTAGQVVLDPFGGAGTTGLVADRLQRSAILIELNPEYAEMARRRIQGDGGMFSTVAAE